MTYTIMLSIKSTSINCCYQFAVSLVAEHFLYPSGGPSYQRRSNKGDFFYFLFFFRSFLGRPLLLATTGVTEDKGNKIIRNGPTGHKSPSVLVQSSFRLCKQQRFELGRLGSRDRAPRWHNLTTKFSDCRRALHVGDYAHS